MKGGVLMKVLIKTDWVTVTQALRILNEEYGLDISRVTLYNHVVSGKIKSKGKNRGKSQRTAWTVYLPALRAYADDLVNQVNTYAKKYR